MNSDFVVLLIVFSVFVMVLLKFLNDGVYVVSDGVSDVDVGVGVGGDGDGGLVLLIMMGCWCVCCGVVMCDVCVLCWC